MLLSAAAGDAMAQCPDGTLPPCSGASVRPAGRVAVSPPAATDRARRYLILPFRNVTRQPDQDWLVEGSTTMLSDALSRWRGITVVPDEKLYPALKRAGISPGAIADAPSVRRVAEETGGWTAVTGEILATGGRVRVTARAWDVPTNRELVRAASEIATGGDVRQAFDSVSLRLLRSVGLDSLPVELSTSTTQDIDAYRAYVRGLAHQRRTEIKSATTAYEEAIKRDSAFALAWMRLADVYISAEPLSIFQPNSRGAQASARAVALSSKLAPRQRALVMATNANLGAQFTEVRRLAEGLLKEDPNDVEALAMMVGLEQFDPILVQVPGGVRPRGSPHAAARYAKRVVELDPSRTSMYGLLAQLYGTNGVGTGSPSFAVAREPRSFPDLLQMMQRRSDVRVFNTLLRDSLVLVPAESLSIIPKDSMKAMRKTLRGIGRSWAEKWLTVAGDQAAPHQLMSVLLSFDGEYPAALRELAAAESIGVQTPTWSAPARRLVLLGKSGDIAGAARIADSLAAGGFFSNPNNFAGSSDAAMWSFALHVLRGRTANAQTLLQQQTAMRKMTSPTAANAELTAFMLLMGNADPEDEPNISRAVRSRQLDSALAHLPELLATPQLGPWMPMMLSMLAEAADTTKKRTATLLKAADAVAGKDPRAAYFIASNAVVDDSTLEPSAGAFPWYREHAEKYNTVKRAAVARMHPGSATVNAQHAVFEWKVDDATPFPFNRAETPPGRTEYRWEVSVEVGARYYRFMTNSLTKSAVATPGSGTLSDILPPIANRMVVGGTLAAGVMKDTTVLSSVPLRVEFASGALRLVVSDTAVVGAMRRTRPAQARFRFEPCIVPVGTQGKRECLTEMISMTYVP